MSVIWAMDGLIFTRCHPNPKSMFNPFWWLGHPVRNEHKTFDCPGEILLNLPQLREWWRN